MRWKRGQRIYPRVKQDDAVPLRMSVTLNIKDSMRKTQPVQMHLLNINRREAQRLSGPPTRCFKKLDVQ